MNTKMYALCLALFAFAIAGCNTTRGVGQDVEAAGEFVEEIADETEDRLSED